MTFVNPHLLYLLLIIPVLIFWYIYRLLRVHPTLLLPSLSSLEKTSGGFRSYFRHLLFILRMIALTLLIIAIARPQTTNSWSKDAVEGIDIVLAIDISGSMLAMDLQPNRIEAAIDVAHKFIQSRPNDNIGLVAFSGESFTMCPLTTDHAVLLNRLEDSKVGLLEDGTAIGLGITTAVSRLKDSKTKSKVIILLTDGSNNRGDITPKMSAQLASTFGIRMYTIGVGTRGEAPYPVPTAFGTRVQMMPVDIDENILTEMADLTGGKYFRAVDNHSLNEIYREIDQLEKTKLSTQSFHTKHEEFWIYALLAFICVLIEFVLRNTYLRTNP
ncbi:aerotolerance regulator BatA [Porphyromonas macacae]|uniref:Aerotolerance regulator BatA n=1 Tax=Porphyromonas macacae TaxID=28115 RepID=A0A0A2E7L8_9PORP|nr:VWA domain-containing protein [Porphyromonas macacae]KGN72454.1 aerotolerance regulator BatA [Porphyromonas macacae]SUB89793.1 Mg-chelatase subunit ChlD [Porphyromonas macacae]